MLSVRPARMNGEGNGVLCIMLGIYAAFEFSNLPKALVDKADRGLSILAVFACAMVAANILTGFTRIRAERIESVLPLTSLTENIIRIVIYGVAGLIVLNSLGISIAPIMATLGVGGLAAALALKDTLSNFFAGFHIVATKQIRVGDYLKLSSQEEGGVRHRFHGGHASGDVRRSVPYQARIHQTSP